MSIYSIIIGKVGSCLTSFHLSMAKSVSFVLFKDVRSIHTYIHTYQGVIQRGGGGGGEGDIPLIILEKCYEYMHGQK